jgi:hypothetical protein
MPGTEPYLTFDEFKAISVVPASYIDEIETVTAGWVAKRILMLSAYIDSRLSKRYDAPFKAPYPFAVQDWVAKIVSLDVWMRRGVQPNDEEFAEYKAQAAQSYDELKEAANSEIGLFDLPLRADTSSTGIVKGAPLVSSEMSPYAWADEQARIGRQEDQGIR